MVKFITFISAFLVFAFGSANADPKKVGFIYIGPPGDHGWTICMTLVENTWKVN